MSISTLNNHCTIYNFHYWVTIEISNLAAYRFWTYQSSDIFARSDGTRIWTSCWKYCLLPFPLSKSSVVFIYQNSEQHNALCVKSLPV
jgi:hypothetical protein